MHLNLPKLDESGYVGFPDLIINKLSLTLVEGDLSDEPYPTRGYAINPIFYLGRPLTAEQMALLPRGYHYNDELRMLWRDIDCEGRDPDTLTTWLDIQMRLGAHENPLIQFHFDRASFAGTGRYLRDTLAFGRVTEPGADMVDLMGRIGNRWPCGEAHDPIPLTTLLTDWRRLPMLYWLKKFPDQKRTVIGNNTVAALASALFPASMRPNPVPKNKGRALEVHDAAVPQPVYLDPALFPGYQCDPTDARRAPVAALPWLVLGVKEDRTGYREFKVPSWMQTPEFEPYSTDAAAIPVERVMVWRSPKGFHLLYVLVKLARWNGCRIDRMPLMPVFHYIPVTVPKVYDQPAGLQGVPLRLQQELWKVPGLTNALKQGINALQGILLNRKSFDSATGICAEDIIRFKPREHVIGTLGGHVTGRANPYEFNARSLPTMESVLMGIEDKARLIGADMEADGFVPLMRPRVEDGPKLDSTWLQPVAPKGRILDL